MAKKNISKLTPVKRMVVRNGKTYETTVYVRNYDPYNSWRKTIRVDTSVLSDMETVDDLKRHLNWINNLDDNVQKEIYRNEVVDFMKRSGIKWDEHEDKALNWMRCMMEVKRKLVLGEFRPEGSSKPEIVKPYKELSKDNARKVVKAFQSGKSKEEQHKIIEQMGITWKKSDHEGINHMRCMMALRQHLQDGNGFTDEVNRILESNPKYEKMMKEEEEKKKKRASEGTIEEMYKNATPIQRKLASITGIFCKDENAVEYMKKAIELGRLPFDIVLEGGGNLAEYNFPKHIEDAFKRRTLKESLSQPSPTAWLTYNNPSYYFQDYLNEYGHKDLENLLKKMRENIQSMRDKHCMYLNRRSLSAKVNANQIARRLRNYDMSGMLKFDPSRTSQDYLGDVTKEILDIEGLSDTEVESIYNAIGGDTFFKNPDEFDPYYLREGRTTLGVLHHLATGGGVYGRDVYDNFINNMLRNGGVTTVSMSYSQQQRQYTDMVRNMKPREIIELYKKSLQGLVDSPRTSGVQNALKTKPIDNALTNINSRWGGANDGDFLESMLEEQQKYCKHNNITDPDLVHAKKFDWNIIVDSLTENATFHMQNFNNDDVQYMMANNHLYNALERAGNTPTRRKSLNKFFQPIPREDWEKLRNNPDKLHKYMSMHIHLCRTKTKKKREAILNDMAEFMKIGDKGTREYNIRKALEGKYDEMIEIEWDKFGTKDHTPIKSAIETVPMDTDEAKDIAKKVIESDDDNVAHDDFKTKVHNIFKVSNLAQDYYEKHDNFEKEKGNTMQLYHGTDQRCMQLILGETGRWKIIKDNSMGNFTGAMLGYGVYVARNFKKASQYMRKDGNSGFSRRRGSRGVIFLGKAILGRMETSKIRNGSYNNKIMERPTTDSVGMFKRHGHVANDEWAMKEPEQYLPEYMIDTEIVDKTTPNSDLVH